MSRKAHRCELNVPDCFNCPYPECYASLEDINRQEAIKNKQLENIELEKRNALIIELYNSGYKNNEIVNHLRMKYPKINKDIVNKVLYNYKKSLQ